MRVVYGINPVKEALKGASPIEKIIVSSGRVDRAAEEIIRAAAAKDIPIERAPREELDRVTGTKDHQGAAAVFLEAFRYSDIEDLVSSWKKTGERALFLILDSIQDPQNLGSLIRASVAAGAHGVIIPKDRACEVTASAVKASAGAAAHAMVARETNISRAIERLKAENVWVAAVEAGSGEDIFSFDLTHDIALVIGSEGKGIRRLVRENCDLSLSIPMSGRIGSLNAAQAGAISMFEVLRQRLKSKTR